MREESLSLSSALCLRLVVEGRVVVGAVATATGGSSDVPGARTLGRSGAKNTGDGEAGEFGMVGRSEAFGEGRFGAVSSARTNAVGGYPQCCEYTLRVTRCPQMARWEARVEVIEDVGSRKLKAAGGSRERTCGRCGWWRVELQQVVSVGRCHRRN